jgi:hypothetical protein
LRFFEFAPLYEVEADKRDKHPSATATAPIAANAVSL